MYKFDLKIFSAKFSGQERDTFEWFAYLMFCHEFEMPFGIRGYKNQAGIEKDPIEYEGQLIGFQAKFFTVKVKERKEELKDAILKAKTKNPELNKIIFYLNQDPSESSNPDKKKPAYILEVEDFGRKKEVEVDWKGPSEFDALLAKEECKRFGEYFFSLGPNLMTVIEDLDKRAEEAFLTIRSSIKFAGDEIKIDRQSVLERLTEILASNSSAIVTGVGGVGKTAVIQDLYASLADEHQFYFFKATEFATDDINLLISKAGDFSFKAFIDQHEDDTNKYLVIDSAEKLSDIKDLDVFHKFLSYLGEEGKKWKLIFTTRHSYLESLQFSLTDFLGTPVVAIHVPTIDDEELAEIACKHSFELPKNDGLCTLLKNPFYLNRFLQSYESFDDTLNYRSFKKILWDDQILNVRYKHEGLHKSREKCFLDMVQIRIDTGVFFIPSDNLNVKATQALEDDEIIKTDEKLGRYFITHDIYEEWALEKIIDRCFWDSEGDLLTFFASLGTSLPIRRAFRDWLSEKLCYEKDEVIPLIMDSFSNTFLEQHWQDEVYVSVLLSDYATDYFEHFEEDLLKGDQNILERMIAILGFACKEAYQEMSSFVAGTTNDPDLLLEFLFRKPKGRGWDCVISLLNMRKEDIKLNIRSILKLLNDWVDVFEDGPTTRHAAELALHYYRIIQDEQEIPFSADSFKSTDYDLIDSEDLVIEIFLLAVSEAQPEVKIILDELIADTSGKVSVLRNKLLIFDPSNVKTIKLFPIDLLKLLSSYWIGTPKSDLHTSISEELPQAFGINSHTEYIESSNSGPLGTPIFLLLNSAPSETIDFILAFTNRAVENYRQSNFKGELKEIKIFVSESEPVSQLVDTRIWTLYRGMIPAPRILTSIHAALEKWLLRNIPNCNDKTALKICLKLLMKSKSASITAIVASVVAANPLKLFEIAKILFKTKPLFIYDFNRANQEESHKALLEGFSRITLDKSRLITEKERIFACDEDHRGRSLEFLMLFYQCSDECVVGSSKEQMKEELWLILDKHYAELPEKAIETDLDKTWRIQLARMDYRGMTFEFLEETKDKTFVKFHPKIDVDLDEYSKVTMAETAESLKHTTLRMWLRHRFEPLHELQESYKVYEDSPLKALSETKDIVDELRKEDPGFCVMHISIPGYACGLMIRDFFHLLKKEDQEYCKNTVTEVAADCLKNDLAPYSPPHPAAQPAFECLSILIHYFPEEAGILRAQLLVCLIVATRENFKHLTKGFRDRLMAVNPIEAQKIFLGYLFMKPKYENSWNLYHKKNFGHANREEHLKLFLKTIDKNLKKASGGSLTYQDIGPLKKFKDEILASGFALSTSLFVNKENSQFFKHVCLKISKIIFERGRGTLTIESKHQFMNDFSQFILSLPKEQVNGYLTPFIENFDLQNGTEWFFIDFVMLQSHEEKCEIFWLVWDLFYSTIVEQAKDLYPRGSNSLLQSYLMAHHLWCDGRKDWPPLKGRAKDFYGKVSRDMGHQPPVLYSLALVLDSIAYNFVDDGLIWLSEALKTREDYHHKELVPGTIELLKIFIRRYIVKNRQKIKESPILKSRVLIILDFLILKGSAIAYSLRDQIL